jgi:hypothetical protein
MVIKDADLVFARETLGAVVDAVALTRALRALGDHPPLALRIARNNALDVAATNWCILFGSDHPKHQALHGKNLFPDTDAFRDGLLKALGMSSDEWSAYWKTVVDYRDEHAAHRDLDPDTTHYPNFDAALAAADFYHDRLCDLAKERLGRDTDGPSLMDQFKERLGICTKQMAAALPAIVALG